MCNQYLLCTVYCCIMAIITSADAKFSDFVFAEETDRLVTEGSNIKVSGAPGAFGKEFKDMEDKLDEVRRIIAGTNVTTEDLDAMREKLNQIR